MKQFVLLLLAILCLQISYAQKEITINKENAGYLTFNILSPFNFNTPRYRFGFAQHMNEYVRLSMDLGYGSGNTTFRNFNNDTNTRDDYQLFEVRPEFNYILNPTRPVQMYLGIEAFFINHTETIFNNYYQVIGTNQQISYSKADFERKKYGGHLKFGVFIPFGRTNRFGINIYGGIGVRARNNTFTNVEVPIDNISLFEDDDIFFDPYYRFEGTEVGLNTALGFKLFYQLY